MTVITAAERDEVRAMAQDLAERELIPRAASLDAADGDAFAKCWHLLVELGLDRMLLNEQHGGVELGASDLVATIEAVAVGDGGVAMSLLLSNAALWAFGEEQLADLVDGARWVLVPVRDGIDVTHAEGQLHGGTRCALGAHRADGFVILATGARPAMWAVPAGSDGLKTERDVAQLGLRAACAASIELAGVTVSAADGDESQRPARVARVQALLHMGTAAIARGIERRAHEMALAYALERRQGGVSIIEHDAVSDMLSAMQVRIARGSQIPARWDETAGDPASAVWAKISATDDAVASTIDAVQVFGGTGYMIETGIEKLMRDAKYCQLFPEPNWIARDDLPRGA